MLPDRGAFATVEIANTAPLGMFMRSAFRFLTGGIEEAICVFFMRPPVSGFSAAITMNSMADAGFHI
jgi:hypothetical protein